jgi:hypothetical protein
MKRNLDYTPPAVHPEMMENEPVAYRYGTALDFSPYVNPDLAGPAPAQGANERANGGSIQGEGSIEQSGIWGETWGDWFGVGWGEELEWERGGEGEVELRGEGWRRRVFCGEKSDGGWGWGKRGEREMERQAAEERMRGLNGLERLSGKKLLRLKRRMREVVTCGCVISVRECECCGEGREGSGHFGVKHKTCKSRICPSCGLTRSLEARDHFESLGEQIDGPPGHSWKFLTITTRYDPCSEEDVTWRALQKRHKLLTKTIRKLWLQDLKKDKYCGLSVAVECSFSGMVHAHCLYFGPDVDAAELTEKVKALGGPGMGHVDKKPIGYGDSEGDCLPKSLGRAAKYMNKGTSSSVNAGYDEGYHGHEEESTGFVMDPRLAVRWDIAVLDRKCVMHYGAFLGVKHEKYKHIKEIEDDSQVACEHCGTVGEWKTGFRRTELWIQHCHSKGKKAVVGGDWIPWWMRKNLKKRDGPPPKGYGVRPWKPKRGARF